MAFCRQHVSAQIELHAQLCSHGAAIGDESSAVLELLRDMEAMASMCGGVVHVFLLRSAQTDVREIGDATNSLRHA